MASIDRLQLSGIRSFEPNPSNKQEIRFHKPLTVILGKNGSGKTTLIEALLNACTGRMPPGAAGADKASFVYDPKVAGEAGVKGQIRLVFTSRNGGGMQVIRSYQVTQSKAQVKFTTLDGTVSVKNPETDKIESASCRCEDLNALVPEHLGVSTAVLEHVVFCHQEDCNWPLGAPAEVKKKFDDIFASTRYVAALDKLRDRAKHYRAEQKDKEAQLLCYREHRDQARQLHADVEAKEEAVRLTKLRNSEMEPRLAQLRAALDALDGVSHNVEALMRDAAVLSGKLEEKRSKLRRLGTAPSESLEELRAALRDFDAQLQRQQREVQERHARADAADATARRMLVESGHAQTSLRLREEQAQEETRRVSALRVVIRRVAPESSAGAESTPLTPAAVAELERQLRSVAEEAQCAVEETERRLREEQASAAAARDTSRREIEAAARELAMLEQQLTVTHRRIAAVRESIPAATVERVSALRSEVEAAAAKLAGAQEARERGAERAAVLALQAEIEATNKRAVAVRQQLAVAHTMRSDATRLNDARLRATRRREQLAALLSARVAAPLADLGCSSDGAASAEELAACAEDVHRHAAEALAVSDSELRAMELDVRVRREQIEAKTHELRVAERDVSEMRGLCVATLGSTDAVARFAEILQRSDEQHLMHSRTATTMEAMSECYDSFVDVAKREQRCAVCRRGLSETELAEFLRANTEMRASVPEKLAQAQRDAAAAAAKVEELKRLEPAARQLATAEALVPELEAKLAALQKAQEDAAAVTEERRAGRAAAERRLAAAAEARAAARDALVVASDAATLEREAAELEEKLHQRGGQDSGKAGDSEALQREHDAAMRELQTMTERLAGLQHAAANSSAETELLQRLAALRHELSRAEDDVARRQREEAAVDAMEVDAANTQARIEELRQHRADAETALKAAEAALVAAEGAVRSGQLEIQTLRAKRVAAEEALRELRTAADAAQPHFANGAAAALVSARDSAGAAERAAQQAAAEAATLRREVEDARRAIGDHHRNRDMLRHKIEHAELLQEISSDQQALHGCKVSLEKLQATRIGEVEELLGAGSAADPPSKLREAIRAKAAELERVRAQNDGRKEALLQDVAALRGQLAKDKYRDVAQRYTATFIKAQTLELAAQDIDKYYKALEKAVASYHQEKIAQINRIIADLWHRTYRGSDIDTVEICSEADAPAGGGDARRSFKYRVVMRRGGTSLDMRGRCSAGQKVLASVVIRMALSEAFCCDCGVLALDEPTTNLDEDNARALAEALRDLIDARSNVRNFQLVVITHDEHFVRALGAKHKDNFYFVTKDHAGAFSVIQERRYDELFA